MSASALYSLDAVQARLCNDIEADRLVYAEEIFDWTDAYSETYSSGEGGGVAVAGGGTGGDEQLQRLRAIGRLWTRYAAMEQQLKQWKKVVQVFEDALQDPSSPSAGCLEVHLAYAAFCRQRGKVGNAQKVFVRALATQSPLHSPPLHPVTVKAARLPVLPPTATAIADVGGGRKERSAPVTVSVSAADLLWAHFLLMMRATGSGGGGSPDLKLEQLYSMLSSQMLSAGGSSLVKPASFALVEQLAASASEVEKETTHLLEDLVGAFVLGKSEEEEDTVPTAMDVEPPEETGRKGEHEVGQQHDESPLKRTRLDSPNLNLAGGTATAVNSASSASGYDPLAVAGGAEVKVGRRRESRFSSKSVVPEEEKEERGRVPLSLPVVNLLEFGDLTSLTAAATGSRESLLTDSAPLLSALLDGYRDRPTLLFSAPHKEPLLSGFANLDATLIGDIEKSFGGGSGGISSGHSSGESLARDLHGAIAVTDSPLARCLGVLEGLWTCQGLQEGHFDKWFNTLLSSHREEEEALRRQHYQEDSKLRACKGSATSLAILRSKHEQALRSLRIHASLQTDLLNANVNRTLCLLRGEQEQVLRYLSFPHSDEVDSEQLYSYYNKQKSQPEKVEKDFSESAKYEHMHTCLLKQRTIIGALLSMCPSIALSRGDNRPPPMQTALSLSPAPQLQRSSSSFSLTSTGSGSDANTNVNNVSTLSPHSPDNLTSLSVEGRGSGSGKKKRRRKLVDVQEQQSALRQRSGSSSSGGYSSGGGGRGGAAMYDPYSSVSAGTFEMEGGKMEKSEAAALLNHQNQLHANLSALDTYGPGAGGGRAQLQSQSHPPSVAHPQQHHASPSSPSPSSSSQLPPPPRPVPHLPPPPGRHLPPALTGQAPSLATSTANSIPSSAAPPPAATSSAKAATNLAKIAALLASKKASKK